MSEQYSGSWRARGAWHGIVAPGRYGRSRGEPGVRAQLREGLSIATIIARKGQEARTTDILAELAGTKSLAERRVTRGGAGDVVWSGQNQWLLVSDRAGFVPQVSLKLTGFAAVSDQTDARAVLRLSGPRVRDVLAKGCMVDLHPRAFAAADTAITSIAHIGVQIWQIGDDPIYDLAVARSMAGSFWSWFEESAAEFGCLAG